MNPWPEPLGYTTSVRAVRAPQRLVYDYDDIRQKPKKSWKSTRMETRSHFSSLDRNNFSMELRPKVYSTPKNNYPGRRNDSRSRSVPREGTKSHNQHRTPQETDNTGGYDSRSRSTPREVPKTRNDSRHARKGYSVPPSSKRSSSEQDRKAPKVRTGPKKRYARKGNNSRSRSAFREVPKTQSDSRHARKGYSVPPSSKRSSSEQDRKGKNYQSKRSGTPFKETSRNYSSQTSRPQTSRIPSSRDYRSQSQHRKDANYEGRKTPARATSRQPGSSRSDKKGGYIHKRFADYRSEPTRRSERIANMRARESEKMNFQSKGPRDVNRGANKPKGRKNTARRPRGSSPICRRSKPKSKYVRKINWLPVVTYYRYQPLSRRDRPGFESREDGHSRGNWAARRPRPPTPLPERIFFEPEANYFRPNDRFPIAAFDYPPSARQGRPTEYKGRKHDPQRPRPSSPTGSNYDPRAKYARKSDRPPQNEYSRSYLPKPSRTTEYRDSGELYNRPGCSSWDDQRIRESPANSPHELEPGNSQENDLYQPPASICDRVSTNSSDSEKAGDYNCYNSMDRSPMDQASTSYGSDDYNIYNPMNRKHFDEPSTSYDLDHSQFFGTNRGPFGGGFWPNYHYSDAETSSPMRVNPSNIPPAWARLHSGGVPYSHNFSDDVWDEPYSRRPGNYSPPQHSRRDGYEDAHSFSSRPDSTQAPVDSIATVQVPESPEVPQDVLSNASIQGPESSEVTDVNPNILPKQEFPEEPDVDLYNTLRQAAESPEMPDNDPRTSQQDHSLTANAERSILPMQGFYGDHSLTANAERSIMPMQGFYGEPQVIAYVHQGMDPNQVNEAYSRMTATLSHVLESVDDNEVTPEMVLALSKLLLQEGRGPIVNLTAHNGFLSATRQFKEANGSTILLRESISYLKSRIN